MDGSMDESMDGKACVDGKIEEWKVIPPQVAPQKVSLATTLISCTPVSPSCA
jgi:hypothetical protein